MVLLLAAFRRHFDGNCTPPFGHGQTYLECFTVFAGARAGARTGCRAAGSGKPCTWTPTKRRHAVGSARQDRRRCGTATFGSGNSAPAQHRAADAAGSVASGAPDRGRRLQDPEAGPARADPHCPAGAGRTAIVIRQIAQRRPSSSVMSTSHSQVVRPAWRLRATACTWPCVAGRMKLVLFERPTAILPSGSTAAAVATEVTVSASAA